MLITVIIATRTLRNWCAFLTQTATPRSARDANRGRRANAFQQLQRSVPGNPKALGVASVLGPSVEQDNIPKTGGLERINPYVADKKHPRKRTGDSSPGEGGRSVAGCAEDDCRRPRLQRGLSAVDCHPCCGAIRQPELFTGCGQRMPVEHGRLGRPGCSKATMTDLIKMLGKLSE